MLLDIDRFKDINDSLGHDRGDELLEQVAERLRGALRDDDVVARLGGDEFAILLPDVRSVANAERLARRVRGLFVPPFMLGELPLHVDTSVGVACLPDHADDASSLMRTADVAMYAAKHHRTGVSVYSADEDDSSPARLVLLGDLHRALTPAAGRRRASCGCTTSRRSSSATGRTVGLEALMRWVHPTRGLLPPTTFIPLAEQSGLIHDVTRYALTECVDAARGVARRGPRDARRGEPVRARRHDGGRRRPHRGSCSRSTPCRRTCSRSRSPRPRWWPTRPGSCRCSSGSARWASGWPSTTSASATRRSPSCGTCPWTS